MKRAVYHSAVWLVLPLWLILLGSVLARVGILAHENHLFATEARHTNGVVLRRIVQHFHGAHNSFMFLLLYTYTAGDLQGRCITEVTPETFDRVQDGGPLPIDYLPENPRDNRIAYPWENIGAVWGPFDDSVLAAMVFVPVSYTHLDVYKRQYYGGSMDNGGAAAFVHGAPVRNWREMDLPNAKIDLYLNGQYRKSGHGRVAMGHPLTSLTWMVNWLRAQGKSLHTGEFVSTGTCTGHFFAAPGDRLTVDFGKIGRVEAIYE